VRVIGRLQAYLSLFNVVQTAPAIGGIGEGVAPIRVKILSSFQTRTGVGVYPS
jgi:hypothetical protein